MKGMMAATTSHQDDGQIRAQTRTPASASASAATTAPAPAPEPTPTPIYQTPDWEIPTNYPPPKRSFRNSLTFLNTAAAAAAAAVTLSPTASRNPDSDGAAAEPAESTKETTTAPAPAPGSGGGNGGVAVAVAAAKKPSLATALQQRLDAVLPPHKKYVFGRRSRRFLLLGIVLPVAILVFVVLPLAVGLGVGLSRRSRSPPGGGAQDLPLPDGDGDVFTGELTYYDVGLGACGAQSGDGDAVCSISQLVFDAAAGGTDASSNPNANPLCGRKIRITRDYGDVQAGAGNRSVDVTVVDRCTGCGPADLDLSPAAFEKLARRESGRVVGSWAWLGAEE